MKLFYVVLVILLFYNLGLTLYVFKINRRLKEFNQILLEIEKGQSKQKLLLKKNNRIDQVGFRVNSILYKYEKRIEESKENLEEMMKQKNIKTIIRDFLVMISI